MLLLMLTMLQFNMELQLLMVVQMFFQQKQEQQSQAVRGDALTQEHLLPLDQVLDFPVVRLNDDQVKSIRLGNWVPWRTPVENLSAEPGCEKFVFTADKDGVIIGLGIYDPGRICPKYFLAGDE